MEYTYEYLGDGYYEVKTGNIVFILDSQDPTQANMINDFNTDVLKLEYFVSLLANNPNTAYSIYNNM